MNKNIKTAWRMGIRDKHDWRKWQWSKEYDTFEELMKKSMPYLKANPGVITRIITRTYTSTIAGE